MSSLGSPREPSRAYWRSLDELSDSPDFRRFVEREFPAWADEMLEPSSRRSFLKLMGASMALAGLTGCRWPREEIVPFAHRPEGFVPGEPRQYATAMDLAGAATGLLVTSYDGRPIKIEGNPDHWQSQGATLAWHQASLLELYDPDRSQRPLHRETGVARWEDFVAFARPHFDGLRATGGRGLAVLAEPTSSPSRADLRARWLAAFPDARWFEYDPLSRDALRAGATLALGAPYRTHLALDRAETIVALDEDLLLLHPAAVRLSRDLVAGRDPAHGRFSRLVAVESSFSLTGTVADVRVPLENRAIPLFAACLAAELFLVHGLPLPAGSEGLRAMLARATGHALRSSFDLGFVAELARAPGRSVIVAGPRQPAEVHALVHVLNEALGNVGETVHYTAEPDPARPHHVDDIRALARLLAGNRVETLVILGGNPLYDAPADLGLADGLPRVKTSIHLSLYADETSQACAWHLPRAHFLESWHDARDWRGTLSVVQPLIEPLYGGKSDLELVALMLGEAPLAGHDIVRRTFAELAAPVDAEREWLETLHAGVRAGTEWPVERPALGGAEWAGGLGRLLDAAAAPAAGSCELVFHADAALRDGRFSNNGWLQELPDPVTKLTWDNAALVAPALAAELGVGQGDLLRLTRDDRSVDLPVFLLPGQAPRTIGVALGYGRRRAGQVGSGAGFDVYPLRRSAAMAWTDVQVAPAGGQYRLATTQDHFALDDLGRRERDKRAAILVRELELADYRHAPAAAPHGPHAGEPDQLWEPHGYPAERWGMAIDLNACTGCGACVVACQAENNIPVVGKDQVARGREMHWIRVDRYFSGDPAAPSVSHQPVTCHHCENAPCEQVCPVAATMHDAEGLNVMVYNRCVGTRYCNNNCPYKVRRFNWFNNHKHESAVEMMVYNPEVTVRSRGVMEKCTFCVQRIQRGKIQARNELIRGENGRAEGRLIRDGEIVPACAQVCPTRAISFGDLADPASRVRAAHDDPRAYGMLEEFNVRPRTRYLARIRNRGGGSAGAA